MAEKLAKMKEKLKKQKQKSEQTLKESVVVEKKKVSKYVPSLRLLEQQGIEEKNMRDMLGLKDVSDMNNPLVKNGYRLYYNSNFKQGIKESVLKEQWEQLKDKHRYIIHAFGKVKKPPWGRVDFIDKILKLTPKDLTDFISKYLQQDLGYKEFYNKWYVPQEILEASIQLSKDYIKTRKSQIKSELQQRLGVEIKGGYYNTLKNIGKTHTEIAKDYITMANALGIKEPEKLTMADLANRLARKEDVIIRKVDPVFAKKVERMSHENLVQEAGTEEYTDDALRMMLLQKNMKKRYVGYKHAILNKSIVERLVLSTYIPIDEEKLKKAYSGMSKNDMDRVILAEKYQALNIEPERKKLINKITLITGEKYDDWTLEQLRKKYKQIESGEEFWQEYDRNTIIETLAQITGKDISEYENVPTELLREEVEGIDYSKKTMQIVSVKKCIQQFRQYKWIDARVKKVLIYPYNDEANRYIGKDILTLEIDSKEYIFYEPKAGFFSLQCNHYADNRFQEGHVLTCFRTDKNPVKFIVIYVIGGPHQYKNTLQGPNRDEKILIQDETILKAEQVEQNRERISQKKQLENLLNKPIDSKSISVASRNLVATLHDMAPYIKEYATEDTPFIHELMDTLKSISKNNESLFSAVADIMVYLQFPQAEIFINRVRNRYYLPTVLPILSPTDKLPEVYDTPQVENKDVISSYIVTRKNQLIDSLARQLLLSYNPTTVRTSKTEATFTPVINYKKDACINPEDMDKINKDNIIFYKDPEDGKIYCVDSVILAHRFSTGNYINPKTQKEFSKEFINLYTIRYFDSVDMKNYTFAFRDLQESFSLGDFTNPITGRDFHKEFIRSVLGDYISHFKRFDKRITRCKNSEKIAAEGAENIILYVDEQDDSTYCFTITEMANFIQKKQLINPYTTREFSTDFIQKFKQLFNLDIILEKSVLERVEEQEEKEEFSLMIPDLWFLVNSTVEEGVSIQETEKETKEETEKETREETEKETREETEKETGEETGDETDKESTSTEEGTEVSFSMSGKGICEHCKNKMGNKYIKSIIYEKSTGPKIVYFCSTKCMEDTNWPKYRNL